MTKISSAEGCILVWSSLKRIISLRPSRGLWKCWIGTLFKRTRCVQTHWSPHCFHPETFGKTKRTNKQSHASFLTPWRRFKRRKLKQKVWQGVASNRNSFPFWSGRSAQTIIGTAGNFKKLELRASKGLKRSWSTRVWWKFWRASHSLLNMWSLLRHLMAIWISNS